MSACGSCEVLYINGVKCHEHGCSEAWKDEERECKECGQPFKPEDKDQQCCDEVCTRAYLGLLEPEDMCDEEDS